MTISVIGTGFVGVVTAGVLASFGNQVYGLDIDPKKVKSLSQGRIPFYEPDLEELVKTRLDQGQLKFTTSYQQAISQSEVIFICVGTPSAPDGQADLKFVVAAAQSLAPHLQPNSVIVLKSTVPPGTNKLIEKEIAALTKVKFAVASMPEFLREGSAVADTLQPDRILIGTNQEWVFKKLEELHQPFQAPIFKMSPESAQMAKYSANSYLATRITFVNQIADLCEKNGADIEEVIQAIGADKRIGSHYWYPGLGYGGSCFPKDVKELAAYSRSIGEGGNLFNRINDFNEERVYRLLDKYEQQVDGWEDKQVAVLGLSFKPNTDDTREAPATKVIPHLLSKGAKVIGFDPMAEWEPDLEGENYKQTKSIDEAVKKADVIFCLVEWPQITGHNFAEKNKKTEVWFFDVRNQFDPDKVKEWGFIYQGVGRH